MGGTLSFTLDGARLTATRRFDSIEQRNKIAVALMQEQGVAIDDLYAVALPAMAEVGLEWRFSAVGAEALRVRPPGGFGLTSRPPPVRDCGCRSRAVRRATLEPLRGRHAPG